MSPGAISYGRALAELAQRDPHRVVVVDAERSVTRGEFERCTNRLARAFAKRGVVEGDFVTLPLPNSIELFEACMATWKLGAVPNPISPEMPPKERDAIIARANPRLVVDAETVATWRDDAARSSAPLPDRVSPHVRALASGGSTGQPKLIVIRERALYDAENASPLFKARRAVLVPGPLYHAASFSSAWLGLLAGARIIVMRRFDATECLSLIEHHGVDRMLLVPTMMLRIWRLPEKERKRFDVSSLEFVMTGGAPCPAWLMRAWIDWLGPERMFEAFGPSERIGGTFITGHEWLAHPGSVGKPIAGARIRILDDDGRELPPGQMGEIYCMPAEGPGSTYRYVGAESRTNADGWESVGDMGYLDDDGYLYLGDRRSDMILSGGRNIYPAEIEAALEAHPAVRSSAVVGLPDDDMGQRLHAILEIDGAPDDETDDAPDDDALRAHLADHLVSYKIPRTFERVGTPLRDDAGKLRRSALRDARLPGGDG